MKKIMFSDRLGLTQAVLDGRKTMTRRIVKGMPEVHQLRINNGVYEVLYTEDATLWVTSPVQPKYKIGEEVAVAQPYKDIIGERVWLKSYVTGTSIHRNIAKKDRGWNNKLFAASEFMPHRIRITDIKVERLQDISDEDCLKEGVIQYDYGYFIPHLFRPYHNDGVERSFRTQREAFSALIDKVSGKGTWERNPWVFVYTFELLKGGLK